MIRPIVFLLLLFPCFSLAQTPTQTLRGKVVDVVTLQPLVGATVSLLGTEAPRGEATDQTGNFLMEEVPVGHYRVQASYLGHGTITLAEVFVEAGRETVLTIQLREETESLGEVVIRAQSENNTGHPASIHTLTTEEYFRYPATFFDPARVVATYPGVAASDDQANHISVRGNSPSTLRWRLEGVDIVNPNHTANAGTFSDRPSAAGGGVSILSAQVLGTSNFLTGAFPSGYGNSIGGIMDMRFRQGNDRQRQFVAQAGLIGLEVAAEGPFKSGSGSGDSSESGGPDEWEKKQSSFLLNYRYSFTGLLTAFGVDFGGEEIGFQDFSFHLNFPTEKAGEFGVFGMAGGSKNNFTSPLDSITEEKELYNIDYWSRMGAIGITHVLPVGKKNVWRTTAALSNLRHDREAGRVALVSSPFIWDDDVFTERKLSMSSIFSRKLKGASQLRIGAQVNQDNAEFGTLAVNNLGESGLSGVIKGWLFQPFAEWQKLLATKWELTTGVHLSHYSFSKKTFAEPRGSLSFSPRKTSRFHIAYGLHSQSQLPQVQALSEDGKQLGPTRSHHAVLGYRQNFSKGRMLTAELYHQSLFDVPVSTMEGSIFSTINLTEFTGLENEKPSNQGTGRNYGFDLSLQKFWSQNSFAMISGSLYRSLFTPFGGNEQATRWDGRYLLSGSSGRERAKNVKEGKVRIWGTSSRLLWLGGFRERTIDPTASEIMGRTAFEFGAGYSNQLKNYFRIDWRTYLKWIRPGRSSMLSLDIQNLTFRENEAFNYYDQFLGRVTLKKQLGFIPILSWRLEF